MAIIATFSALPISVFTNRPNGPDPNDVFVLGPFSASDLRTVEIDDDDNTLDGDTITNESPDDANQIATVRDSSGTVISVDACYVEFTAVYSAPGQPDVTVWRIELDNGLRLFALSPLPTQGVAYSTNSLTDAVTNLDPDDIPSVPCLTHGTAVQTPNGAKPIEGLEVGSSVQLSNNCQAVIRWVGSKKLCRSELAANPKLYPVRISAGALGRGLPERDLVVSRQHRMMVRSKIAKRMFGEEEVLVAAIRLTVLPGVFIDHSIDSIEYFHLAFDQHAIFYAEGAPTESLYFGPEALNALAPEARDEVLTIFPELADLIGSLEPARLIPQGRQQRTLVARHLKNNKPVVQISD